MSNDGKNDIPRNVMPLNNESFDLTKMSIPQIAKLLEERKLNPAGLDREVVLECVAFFKTKYFTDTMIADILEKKERSIRRYTRKLRQLNSLNISEDFQKELMGEMLYNWRFQLSHFVRLAADPALSSSDRMRAIYYSHQIEKDIIEMLAKFGYISKERGLEDVKKDIEKDRDRREDALEDVYVMAEDELEDIPIIEIAELKMRLTKFIEEEKHKLKVKHGISEDK